MLINDHTMNSENNEPAFDFGQNQCHFISNLLYCTIILKCPKQESSVGHMKKFSNNPVTCLGCDAAHVVSISSHVKVS